MSDGTASRLHPEGLAGIHRAEVERLTRERDENYQNSLHNAGRVLELTREVERLQAVIEMYRGTVERLREQLAAAREANTYYREWHNAEVEADGLRAALREVVDMAIPHSESQSRALTAARNVLDNLEVRDE